MNVSSVIAQIKGTQSMNDIPPNAYPKTIDGAAQAVADIQAVIDERNELRVQRNADHATITDLTRQIEFLQDEYEKQRVELIKYITCSVKLATVISTMNSLTAAARPILDAAVTSGQLQTLEQSEAERQSAAEMVEQLSLAKERLNRV